MRFLLLVAFLCLTTLMAVGVERAAPQNVSAERGAVVDNQPSFETTNLDLFDSRP